MTILTNANANAGSYTTKPSGDSEGMWGGMMTGAARWMPDTLASLVVGRNSRFFTEELDDEELEQIGGVEYRALRLLSYAVAAVSPFASEASQSGTKQDGVAGQGRLTRQYIFLFQAIPFAILAIYFAKVSSWDSVFQSSLGIQAGTINKTWFALFSTVSAYTGTGLT
jgi:hypothetical protein